MATILTAVETLVLRGFMGLPVRVQRVLAGRPIRVDGQQLGTEIQLMMRLQKLTRQPGLAMLPLVPGRERIVSHSRMVGGKQPIGALRELSVDGADGPLAARLSTPPRRPAPPPGPPCRSAPGGGP